MDFPGAWSAGAGRKNEKVITKFRQHPEINIPIVRPELVEGLPMLRQNSKPKGASMNEIRQRAQTFDTNAAIYDDVRPGYPDQLYRDIQEYAGITEATHILEIGAGNGIATHEMACHWNADITALEPGADLLAIARQRCRQFPRVQFVQSTFEEYDASEQFDVITSATAFHWVDPAIKLTKPAKLLKDGGVLAVFWNNYFRDDDVIFDEINTAYTHYHPTLSGVRDIRQAIREKIQTRIDELRGIPAFRHVQHKEYSFAFPLTTDGYLKLLKTFSPNAICSPDDIAPFYQEIKRIFEQHNNRITQPVLVNLEILQKT
jgi:trans-aconitate methyltransferase